MLEYIPREAVYDGICGLCKIETRPERCLRKYGLYGGCLEFEAIRKIPTAQVNPVSYGEWIDTGSGMECSVCGEIQYGYDNFRFFCGYCGAYMLGIRDNNKLQQINCKQREK